MKQQRLLIVDRVLGSEEDVRSRTVEKSVIDLETHNDDVTE